jgi:hypothetical protein
VSSQNGPRFVAVPYAHVVVIAALAVALAFAGFRPLIALAGHMQGWTHDHSSNGVPPRPHGYDGLVDTFGQPCSNAADNARSYWPSQSARNVGGYIEYHSYIARNVGHNVRSHIEAAHRNAAVDYGVYGYVCRQIRGSTLWSTHAFGAAIDTNSARNPLGQSHWDGRGADGTNYGTYIPDTWRAHRFFWGINWSRPDPMHFQYVTGY